MYYLISGKYEIEGEKYTSYGIGCESVKVEDISTDKEKICELIEKMNEQNLSPVHMYDVIYDFIGW